jgi:hypothetical protein
MISTEPKHYPLSESWLQQGSELCRIGWESWLEVVVSRQLPERATIAGGRQPMVRQRAVRSDNREFLNP